jgi:D-sedoheptulose 7-phosphate isomerase
VQHRLNHYFATLVETLRGTEVTDRSANKLPLEQGCEWLRSNAHQAHDGGNRIIFIGNGGSAAIASHLAIDFSKNGGLRSLALNDAAALTCLSNDFGYEHVFAKQLELHARPGDLLVAISSSGQSPSILNATIIARDRNCKVATFSGFNRDNELRQTGDINFYVRSSEYGFVEIAHLTLCHAVLDLDKGWAVPAQDQAQVYTLVERVGKR